MIGGHRMINNTFSITFARAAPLRVAIDIFNTLIPEVDIYVQSSSTFKGIRLCGNNDRYGCFVEVQVAGNLTCSATSDRPDNVIAAFALPCIELKDYLRNITAGYTLTMMYDGNIENKILFHRATRARPNAKSTGASQSPLVQQLYRINMLECVEDTIPVLRADINCFEYTIDVETSHMREYTKPVTSAKVHKASAGAATNEDINAAAVSNEDIELTVEDIHRMCGVHIHFKLGNFMSQLENTLYGEMSKKRQREDVPNPGQGKIIHVLAPRHTNTTTQGASGASPTALYKGRFTVKHIQAFFTAVDQSRVNIKFDPGHPLLMLEAIMDTSEDGAPTSYVRMGLVKKLEDIC